MIGLTKEEHGKFWLSGLSSLLTTLDGTFVASCVLLGKVSV